MIGKQLAHYEIVRKIGAGGMGEVYVANDGKLHREVALKVLPEGLADDPDRLERFEREAKTVAALNHPNIVTIYSVEEAEGIRFMTMELVSGQTLGELIPADGMAVKKFIEIAEPLADAIAAAHAGGVQHRDIKPPNVMVDDHGRVKVLDFGLAKQRSSSGPEGVTQMLTGELTGEGKIIGTVAYMSPEQAEGRALDHRSDIFSLGILMYEMITGQRPFDGDTNLSILSSILKDDPSSVSDVRASIPIPIARLIQRALAKQPQERYQSAADLRQDLSDIRRDLDTGEALSSGLYSGTHAAPGLSASRPWLRWLGYAAGVAAIVALTAVTLPMLLGPARGRSGASDGLTRPADFRPAVAVFYFDNITNDEELEWLRTGLTDMLVTDLSQSSGVRVLATDRLYSLLQDLGEQDAATTAFNVVRQVAGRAQMNTAIVGSYARAGEEIRINLRIQNPGTGDVIASQSVQGATDGIFDLVDDLTDWVEAYFEVDASDGRGAIAAGAARGADAGVTMADMMEDRDLNEVTTTDLAAYRLYAEGVKLNLESKEELAIPLLEAAVERDPDFAMAHAKLSVAYGNQNDPDKAEEFARRAFERSDKLPPRERHYIRGRFLSMHPETVAESIEEYSRAVEMFPDHTAARHNLATQLTNLERYGEAIPHLEQLRALGHRFAPSYQQLALAYSIEGNHAAGVEALTGFTRDNPTNAQGYFFLAQAHARNRDYEAALTALDEAAALTSSSDYPAYRWNIYVLAERWDEADALSGRLIDIGDDEAFAGYMQRAKRALYFGSTTESRANAMAARELVAEGTGRWMYSTSVVMDAYELDEDYDRMLEEVDTARASGYNSRTAQQIEISDAIVRAKMGDQAGAAGSLRRFEAEIEQLPLPERTRRRINAQVDGLIAMARRDVGSASRNMRTALEANPARDVNSEGIQIRFYLGESLWNTDRHDEAAEQFRAIETAGMPRVELPQYWVRALWYLGQYHADNGDDEMAAGYFARFIDYWGEGELDRDRVARARAFLAR
jgi:tetratricopeptide (TPR) repeat protein